MNSCENFLTVEACALFAQVVPVRIVGLVGRKDLNGKQGYLGGFNAQAKRHQVALSQGKTTEVEVVAIKPINVIYPDSTRVRIDGLKTVRHNGRCGMVLKHDNDSGRYSVQVSRDEILKLKRENCLCL